MVALGTLVAFLPVVFSDTLAANADAVGTSVLELLGALSPVLCFILIVAAAGLLLALFPVDEF